MSISKDKILEALSHVEDPDFKKDLVSLKMIENIKIKRQKLSFTIVLTTPACPLKDQLRNDCVRAIHERVSPDLEVEVEFSSRVTTLRQDLNLLPGVKNIIAVASGKGGVGKSTVAANLAVALAQDGARVGLLDADIYGPSLPTMFGIKSERPQVKQSGDKHLIIPIERYGVKLLSIGLLIDEMQAVVWRGPMASSALRQFVTDVDWGELDYLILDLPPGTGDIHLTVVQTMPVTGALIVTTPQEVAMADARKGVAMFKMAQIKVPILGVVENMSYFTPPELPDKKYHLFGKGGGEKLAEQFDIPLLAELPLVESIRECGDSGMPASLQNEEVELAFQDLARNLARQVSLRNANQEATKTVELSN